MRAVFEDRLANADLDRLCILGEAKRSQEVPVELAKRVCAAAGASFSYFQGSKVADRIRLVAAYLATLSPREMTEIRQNLQASLSNGKAA